MALCTKYMKSIVLLEVNRFPRKKTVGQENVPPISPHPSLKITAHTKNCFFDDCGKQVSRVTFPRQRGRISTRKNLTQSTASPVGSGT